MSEFQARLAEMSAALAELQPRVAELILEVLELRRVNTAQALEIARLKSAASEPREYKGADHD